jgi:hypothetical protein
MGRRKADRGRARAGTLLLNAALVALLSVAGCDEGAVQPAAVNVRMFLSATPDEGLNPAVAAQSALVRMGTIPPEAVDSIMLALRGVAAISPNDGVDYAFALSLMGPALAPINFRSLPSNAAEPLEIAQGTLPSGMYDSWRLRFESATITFNQPVSAGGVDFEPGTYPMRMMHGIDFAADVPVQPFTIAAGPMVTSVYIRFDVRSSISSITTDEEGNLIMNPVFAAN